MVSAGGGPVAIAWKLLAGLLVGLAVTSLMVAFPVGAEQQRWAFLAGSEDEIEKLQGELQRVMEDTAIAELALPLAEKNLTAQKERLARAQSKLAATKLNASVERLRLREAENRTARLEAELNKLKVRIAEAESNKSEAERQLKDAKQREADALRHERDVASHADTITREAQAAAAANASAMGGGKVYQSGVWALNDWLRTCEYQFVIAAVAGILGLFSVWDAWIFSRGFAIGYVALVVGMATSWQVNAHNALESQLGSCGPWAVGLEAAFVTAVACHIGFEGFQLMFGAALGLVMAHWASGIVMADSWAPVLSLMWYAMWGLSIVILIVVGQRRALALLGSFVGGLLFASLIGYMVVSFLAADVPTWIDFTDAVVSGKPFTSSPFARDLTLATWVIIASMGIIRWGFKSFEHRRNTGSLSSPLLKSTSSPLP